MSQCCSVAVPAYGSWKMRDIAPQIDGTWNLVRGYLNRGGLQVAPRAGAILSENWVLLEGFRSVVKSSLNGGLRMRKCLRCKYLWCGDMK